MGREVPPWAALAPCRTGMPDVGIWRPRQTRPQPPPTSLHRSDIDHITSITTAANGGLAMVGGWYVYVTLPYLYVAPIIELGVCSLKLPSFLSFGGPDECNYDDVEKTCKSGKTIKDTMGDQGWPGMWYNVGNQGRGGLRLISHHRVP